MSTLPVFRVSAVILLFSLVLTANYTMSAELIDMGPNLVKNPSFESVTPKDAGDTKAILPDDWRGATNVYRRDDTVARLGNASLRYENDNKDRYTLCVQDQDLKPGVMYRYSVWVKTQVFEEADKGATISIEWNDQNGKWMGGSYAKAVSGTSDWTRISGMARIPKDATSPRLELYARKQSTGTAWFDDVELVRVIGPAFSTIVASPIYRGWILTDEQNKALPQEAIVHAKVTLEDYELSPEQVVLHAVLRRVNDAGQVEEPILQEAVTKPGELNPDGRVLANTAALKFSTANLTPGTYDTETRLLGPDGKSLGVTHEKLVRKEDGFKPRSRIDEHRRLLIDGQPFFPLGMYWSSINEEDLKLYADSKFNCVMPYGAPDREKMDLAQKFGIKVIYSVKDWYFGSQWYPQFLKSVADEEPALRKRVQEFRDHPALLAWYLNDELPQEFLPQLETHQQIVSQEDPDHPTWIVLYQVKEIGHYRRTCDVIGSDPYPIGRPDEKQAMPSVAGQWTVETSRQLNYSRPMWQVPQVFNWANYRDEEDWKKHGRTPSFDEMRSMAWQCITEGATGLIFYSWRDIHRNPDVPFETQWERLKRIAAEVDQMAPILLSIDSAPTGDKIVADLPVGVHLLVKSHQGKLYVFSVNDGTTDATIAFKLKIPQAIRVLGEDRTIAPTTDGFSDTSEKLSVHIYEITP